MQAPNALLQVLTIPPGATNTQARIVLDGLRGAIFVYQNGGPLGALIGSWAGKAGTDPYGNVYPAGIDVLMGSITGVTFNGTNFIFNNSGLFFYSATPAANNLIGSITNASGNDGFGNAYLSGTWSYFKGSSQWTAMGTQAIATGGATQSWYYTPGLTETGWILGGQWQTTPGVSSPTGSPLQYTANGQGLLIGTTGTAEPVGIEGWIVFGEQGSNAPTLKSGFLDITASAAGAFVMDRGSGYPRQFIGGEQVSSGNPLISVGNTATLTNFSPILTIPANDAVVNSRYEIEIQGFGTLGATTVEGMTFTLSINGTTFASAPVGVVLFSAVSQTFSFTCRASLHVITSGASGTAHGHLTGVIANTSVNRGGSTQATLEGAGSTNAAFNTTISNTMVINYQWSGAGGAAQVADVATARVIRYGT